MVWVSDCGRGAEMAAATEETTALLTGKYKLLISMIKR
jgi:hypothetical protein